MQKDQRSNVKIDLKPLLDQQINYIGTKGITSVYELKIV